IFQAEDGIRDRNVTGVQTCALTIFTKPDEVETVQKPITLPEITNVHAQYTFGGPSLIKARLTWDGSEDDRVVYRVYQKKEGVNERIGEVTGETTLEISNPALLESNVYYVVAYDPLTKLEGKRSELVELSM